MKRTIGLSSRFLTAGIVLAVQSLALSVTAQPVVYTYDAAGNPVVISAATPGQPSIVTAPQSTLIQSNSIASFSVVATGSGLFYQWLSNNIPIAGATNATLLLPNLPVTSTNLGGFSVIVSNASGSVTSAPAALWSDVNGNGVPDWWELKYFGNINQPGLADYDGDGVDNLDEYLEGTNPTNRLSFDPRLYIQLAHGSGSVSVSPDQPYYTMGQVVTLTANPGPGQGFAGWSGAVSGTKPAISFPMNTNEYVTADFGLALGVALGNTNLVWSTTGDELWFGQADVTEDGMGAAQSGPIVSYYSDSAEVFVGDQTSLQTTFFIAQPEQLGFWWDVSSDPPAGVSFSINSNVVATLSGEAVAWQYLQTNLAAGVYTLNWTYSKGPVDVPNGLFYSDAAWVGDVSLVSSTVPAPLLGIQATGPNSVLLYWPVSADVFRLQQTASLSAVNWINTTNIVNEVGGTNQVSITPAGNGQFYRLVYP